MIRFITLFILCGTVLALPGCVDSMNIVGPTVGGLSESSSMLALQVVPDGPSAQARVEPAGGTLAPVAPRLTAGDAGRVVASGGQIARLRLALCSSIMDRLSFSLPTG